MTPTIGFTLSVVTLASIMAGAYLWAAYLDCKEKHKGDLKLFATTFALSVISAFAYVLYPTYSLLAGCSVLFSAFAIMIVMISISESKKQKNADIETFKTRLAKHQQRAKPNA